ncbi:GNAT family N-acetyltransferase [Brevibacillus reuszeri]|uniref:GNAT family N-acetyltransferase n=1 Tax=Brevibacillus reuszeri TaxID=54915 RepID=UPI000CCBF546|nr:GNAT family N-acetyltransferase [Brevibacillus reuszeri]
MNRQSTHSESLEILLGENREIDYSGTQFSTTYQKEYQLVTGIIHAKKHGELLEIGEVQLYLIDENWLESNVYQLAEKVDPVLFKAIRSVRFYESASRLHRDPFTCLVFGRIAVLTDLQIKEEYQRKGLGQATLEELEEYLSKVLHVSFLIAPANAEKDVVGFNRLFTNAAFEYTNGDGHPHFCKKIMPHT